MATNRSQKRSLAILGVNAAVTILVLLTGLYWFAFRQPTHHGYFELALGVLFLSCFISMVTLLISASAGPNAEWKRRTRQRSSKTKRIEA
jgi:hypothetical protein